MMKPAIISIALALAATSDGAPAKATEKTAIDPQAVAALHRMSAFLRQQQSFTVRTTTETDYELASGQTVRMQAHGELLVRRPDHLRADVASDRKEREFFYDGKSFVMYAPRVGFYTRIAAPPTLLELADTLGTRYGVQLPMVDLFRWGTPESPTSELTGATYIGVARIDGVDTDQYAFRQPGLDWQLWIQRGDKPLPRKVLLTTTDDPARPEHAVEMSWQLDAKHPDSAFTFTPPKDAAQIDLAEVKAPSVSAR